MNATYIFCLFFFFAFFFYQPVIWAKARYPLVFRPEAKICKTAVYWTDYDSSTDNLIDFFVIL